MSGLGMRQASSLGMRQTPGLGMRQATGLGMRQAPGLRMWSGYEAHDDIGLMSMILRTATYIR